MSPDKQPANPPQLTYVECVLVGAVVVFAWVVVIVTSPIALPLAGIGYLALRSEDRAAA